MTLPFGVLVNSHCTPCAHFNQFYFNIPPPLFLIETSRKCKKEKEGREKSQSEGAKSFFSLPALLFHLSLFSLSRLICMLNVLKPGREQRQAKAISLRKECLGAISSPILDLQAIEILAYTSVRSSIFYGPSVRKEWGRRNDGLSS